MRYRIKFYRNGILARETALRFWDWKNAELFLTRIFRYRFDSAACTWIKGSETAEIVCANGIPF